MAFYLKLALYSNQTAHNFVVMNMFSLYNAIPKKITLLLAPLQKTRPPSANQYAWYASFGSNLDPD